MHEAMFSPLHECSWTYVTVCAVQYEMFSDVDVYIGHISHLLL